MKNYNSTIALIFALVASVGCAPVVADWVEPDTIGPQASSSSGGQQTHAVARLDDLAPPPSSGTDPNAVALGSDAAASGETPSARDMLSGLDSPEQNRRASTRHRRRHGRRRH